MENQQTTEKLPTSKAVIAYLAEQFPQCFNVAGEAKPLKIGIFEDLATRLEGDPKVSKTRLRGALRQYTNSWRYLRCVVTGAQRVDLDGADAGVVEDDHASHAQESLAESKAKAAEKRKAQQKTQQAEEKPKSSHAASASKGPSENRKPAVKRVPKQGKPSGKKPAPKQEIKLTPASKNEIQVGQNVQVKLGQLPVAGTVTAVEKSEIQVQLVSGMTMKVKAENLFIKA